MHVLRVLLLWEPRLGVHIKGDRLLGAGLFEVFILRGVSGNEHLSIDFGIQWYPRLLPLCQLLRAIVSIIIIHFLVVGRLALVLGSYLGTLVGGHIVVALLVAVYNLTAAILVSRLFSIKPGGRRLSIQVWRIVYLALRGLHPGVHLLLRLVAHGGYDVSVGPKLAAGGLFRVLRPELVILLLLGREKLMLVWERTHLLLRKVDKLRWYIVLVQIGPGLHVVGGHELALGVRWE